MPEPGTSVPKTEDQIVEEGKVWAAISYIWILWIVTFITQRENKFAVFHAKQALLLFIASIIAWVIPVIGWFVLTPIIAILAIVGIIQSLMGRYWRIPLIADLADKIKI
ncbi:MAG TPA: hypothetical protein GX506_07645 [Firmicutes bacterium]|nr:hypothetical protein [Bacillota bacterium]